MIQRQTVMVEVPRDAEVLLQLAERILLKHLGEVPTSPFNITAIAELHLGLNMAKIKHQEALRFGQTADAFLERDIVLGIHSPECAPGSVLHCVDGLKEALLVTYQGREQQLETLGFKVSPASFPLAG